MVSLIFLGRLVDITGNMTETLDLSSDIKTTTDLRAWLNARFPDANPGFDESVRIALDNEICAEPSLLGSPREIAFLPPVGGG